MTQDTDPARRRFWTFGLVAGASAAAGLGWQWLQPDATPAAATDAAAPTPVAAADAAASSSEGGDWWAQRFERPEGGELALAALRGQPLLVNFWATWCPPCVKEMPQLDRFSRENKQGVQVIGLAVDGPTPVREFLKKTPVGFGIGLAGFAGTELARALGNPSGGLPFSVLFDARGEVVQRKLGETNHAELMQWADALRV